MQNKDKQCFKWAVTRALNAMDKNPQRVTKELRKQSEELNWDGQQQVHERLQPGRTQCFHPVHGRQQPLRMGNEPTPSGYEFQMVIVG